MTRPCLTAVPPEKERIKKKTTVHRNIKTHYNSNKNPAGSSIITAVHLFLAHSSSRVVPQRDYKLQHMWLWEEARSRNLIQDMHLRWKWKRLRTRPGRPQSSAKSRSFSSSNTLYKWSISGEFRWNLLGFERSCSDCSWRTVSAHQPRPRTSAQLSLARVVHFCCSRDFGGGVWGCF